MPANWDCKACRFAGCQKYSEKNICFITGTEDCAKELEARDNQISIGIPAKEAIELWNGVQSQWNVGFGGPVGLRYEALPIVAGALEIDLTPEVFRHIQMLEANQLNIWAEEAKAKEGK